MNLRDYVSFIRRYALVLIAGAVAGLAVSVGVLLLIKPSYTASTMVFVSTGSATSVDELNQGATFGQQAVHSYAEVATSEYVLRPVIQDLGLKVTPEYLARHVTAAAGDSTAVITITAQWSSSSTAADIANASATYLTRAVASLTPGGSSGASDIKVTQIETATPPTNPSSPDVTRTLLIGVFGGVVLAILLGLIREALDTRVRDGSDVERIISLPILGRTLLEKNAGRNLIPPATQSGQSSESYRSLRTNLAFAQAHIGDGPILVTSSRAGEGKTTTAINLAQVLAANGVRTVLVDADLRRPRVASVFGIEQAVGLTDLLLHRVGLEEAVQEVLGGTLHALPAGQLPPNPSELLGSDRMRAVIDELVGRFDAVILDAPPVLPVTDAVVLAEQVSGVLFVVGSRIARRHDVRAAVSSLTQVEAPLLGAVITMLPSRSANGYSNYYNYDGGIERA